MDDLSIQTLELSDPEVLNADYGVFVTNSGKENELFQNLKQLAQPLLQNDKANFSDIIKMFKATSSAGLEDQIVASEQKAEEAQMAQIKAQQEAQQQAIQMQAQMQELTFKHEKDLQAQKDAAALEREIIKATSWGGDVNENNVPDVLEIEKFKHQSNVDVEKVKLENKKLEQEKQENEKERKSKEKIARMKKASPSK